MMHKKQELISRLGADHHGRNIIAEYSDFGSQMFAPLTKLGLFPDRCQRRYRVKSHFLNSFRGAFYLLRLFCVYSHSSHSTLRYNIIYL